MQWMIALTSATEAKKAAAQTVRSRISKISLGGAPMVKGLEARRSTVQHDQANDAYAAECERNKDGLDIDNGEDCSKQDNSFADIYGTNDDSALQISIKNDFNLKQNESML